MSPCRRPGCADVYTAGGHCDECGQRRIVDGRYRYNVEKMTETQGDSRLRCWVGCSGAGQFLPGRRVAKLSGAAGAA